MVRAGESIESEFVPWARNGPARETPRMSAKAGKPPNRPDRAIAQPWCRAIDRDRASCVGLTPMSGRLENRPITFSYSCRLSEDERTDICAGGIDDHEPRSSLGGRAVIDG